MTVKTRNGNITANKKVLNELSQVYFIAADYYKSRGYDILANDLVENANCIYDALNTTGYYNDCPGHVN